MTRIIMMTADNATKALKLHHDAFSNGPCTACKGGCCIHCAGFEGYLEGPKKSVDAMKKKYNFNSKTGFQGPKGCNIPVAERSDVCVGFSCPGYGGFHGNKFGGTWFDGDEIGPVWQFTVEQRQANAKLRDLLHPTK